mgnify:CR=1 FL=1
MTLRPPLRRFYIEKFMSVGSLSAEELRATFDDANTSGDDSISMQEFLVWVKTTMLAGPEADGGS